MAGPAKVKRGDRRRLPGLEVPITKDQELRRFLEAVSEHLSVHEGERNAPKERFVTVDDLDRAGVITTKVRSGFASIEPGDAVANSSIVFPTAGSTTFAGLSDVNIAAAQFEWMLRYDGNTWSVFDFDTESRSIDATWSFGGLVTFQENVLLGPGKSLFFFDPDEAFVLDMSHDGTDFNADFTDTTDWNITGLTAIQAGTVDVDFDAVTATSYGGILEANLLDKSAAETVTGDWIFSGLLTVPVATVTAHEAAINHDALLNFVAAEHIDWSVTGAEDVHVDRIRATQSWSSREGTVDEYVAPGNATSTTSNAGYYRVECLFACTTSGSIELEMRSEVNGSSATVDGDGSYVVVEEW